VEAIFLTLLEAKSQDDRTWFLETVKPALSPEDRVLAGALLQWWQEFRAWDQTLRAIDAEQDRLRQRIQSARTQVMVALASNISAAEQAYYLGLMMNLGEELNALSKAIPDSRHRHPFGGR